MFEIEQELRRLMRGDNPLSWRLASNAVFISAASRSEMRIVPSSAAQCRQRWSPTACSRQRIADKGAELLGKLVSARRTMLTTLSLAASRPRLRILAGEAAVAGGTVPVPRNSMFAMMEGRCDTSDGSPPPPPHLATR
jgi:hypothetical protein